jgi:hypothetical protein
MHFVLVMNHFLNYQNSYAVMYRGFSYQNSYAVHYYMFYIMSNSALLITSPLYHQILYSLHDIDTVRIIRCRSLIVDMQNESPFLY